MKKYVAFLLILLLLSGCTPQGDPQPTITAPTETYPQKECANHADADDNGLCDICQTSLLVSFDFFCVNDLHGKVADGENHPGVDELTSYLDDARRENKNTLILSAGDMWQGSSESNLTHGVLTTEWMNHAGFLSMTLGNHEYDWGEDAIWENFRMAQFPYLAINVYSKDTGHRVGYCQSSVTVDMDGVQIGVIGAMGDCYSSIAADKSEAVYFVTGDELTALVMEEADRLRGEGVDFIIYVIHDGYGRSSSGTVTDAQLSSYYNIALSNGYVDLVFEGHTHQKYLLKDSLGVLHLQNGGDNKGISHVEVTINQVTGTSETTEAELISTGVYVNWEDDPVVEELLEKYSAQIAAANEIHGYNSMERSSGQLKQLVADLYYKLGMEVWGETYDIVLGGGFISVRSPYSLRAGEVEYATLQSLLPFDNRLALCAISGEDLLTRFFQTDNDNYYISYSDYGRDVWENLDPDGIYYIVLDSYSYTYAPNNVVVIEEYYEGVYARDLVAEFIRGGGYE